MHTLTKTQKLALQDPFGLSRGTRTAVNNLFVQIGEGYGEGAPVYYKGQNAEDMFRIAKECFNDLTWLTDKPASEIIEGLFASFPNESGLIEAIDLALHDAAAKEKNVSLCQYLAIEPKSDMLSSFTIGLDTLDVVLEKTRRARSYPILKVKVGGEHDLEMLEAIQNVAEKPVYIDANEGWSVEQTLEWLPRLKALNVRLVEQPLARDDWDGCEAVFKDNPTDIPLMIDEGVQNPADVKRWVGRADGINVKLAKCGGITRALECIRIARQHDLKVMLGCMIESSLAISAAMHIAPLADYIDLDGAELLADDPFEGGAFHSGRLKMPVAPGIGASPNDGTFFL